MAGFILIVSILGGGAFGDVLASLSLTVGTGPWIAALTHLAVSSVYGLVYGLIYASITQRWRWKTTIWLALALGVLYSLILGFVAVNILVQGTAYLLPEIPTTEFLGAHLVFGLALSGLIFRRQAF